MNFFVKNKYSSSWVFLKKLYLKYHLYYTHKKITHNFAHIFLAPKKDWNQILRKKINVILIYQKKKQTYFSKKINRKIDCVRIKKRQVNSIFFLHSTKKNYKKASYNYFSPQKNDTNKKITFYRCFFLG